VNELTRWSRKDVLDHPTQADDVDHGSGLGRSEIGGAVGVEADGARVEAARLLAALAHGLEGAEHLAERFDAQRRGDRTRAEF
jgi:hypothetical protein